MNTSATPNHITRDDLEQKLRAFQGDIKGRVENQKTNLIAVGAGIGVVLLLVFFLLGRRSGKKKSTVVEIRRI